MLARARRMTRMTGIACTTEDAGQSPMFIRWPKAIKRRLPRGRSIHASRARHEVDSLAGAARTAGSTRSGTGSLFQPEVAAELPAAPYATPGGKQIGRWPRPLSQSGDHEAER